MLIVIEEPRSKNDTLSQYIPYFQSNAQTTHAHIKAIVAPYLLTGSNLQIPILNTSKSLQQTYDNIGHFCDNQLLSQANPRPSTKKKKRPARPEIVPSFRSKVFSIIPTNFLVLIEIEYVQVKTIAFSDQDWCFPCVSPSVGRIEFF